MQRKLSEEQISNCRNIARLLDYGTLTFGWFDTEEGSDYWVEVVTKLREKVHYCTSDGKPYIEPEPPIPEGWRKANADEYKRRDVQFWHLTQKAWVRRPIQGDPFDPPKCNTYYIVPIDPPLTDQDACVWPRLLVMVRDKDYHIWEGPCTYLGNDGDTTFPYVVFFPGRGSMVYAQARRATPEEIEAAK